MVVVLSSSLILHPKAVSQVDRTLLAVVTVALSETETLNSVVVAQIVADSVLHEVGLGEYVGLWSLPILEE